MSIRVANWNLAQAWPKASKRQESLQAHMAAIDADL